MIRAATIHTIPIIIGKVFFKSDGYEKKLCKRNNRQNIDNTKITAKQGNAEERPDAGCGIKR